MSDARNMRKYMKLIEGELIPQRQHTIRVKGAPYDFMRALLHIPSPENFTTANHYGGAGIISTSDPDYYKQLLDKLKQFKIDFEEEEGSMTTHWDRENQPEDEHTMSPYPSNKGIQKHWDDKASHKGTGSTEIGRKKNKMN